MGQEGVLDVLVLAEFPCSFGFSLSVPWKIGKYS
jgi:hypothetical protein